MNLKKKMGIDIDICLYMSVYLNHFAVHLKLTQYCRSTMI